MASQFTDLFLTLPDSLQGVIFNKLEDVKRLYQFYHVSEQLASIVSETRFLCVVLPYQMVLASREKAVWPKGLMSFLEKFDSIESITLIFSPAPPTDNLNYIRKWRLDANGFVFLKARKSNAIPEGEMNIYRRPQLSALRFRTNYMRDLKKRFPSLRKISNPDIGNQGTFILEDQALEDLKRWQPVSSKVTLKVWLKENMEYSGTILKDIQLHFETEENVSEEDLIKNAFSEGEAELAAMIMKEEPTIKSCTDMDKYYSGPR